MMDILILLHLICSNQCYAYWVTSAIFMDLKSAKPIATAAKEAQPTVF